MAPRRVTLKDVAGKAGVSIVTASRVLNGSATPIPLSEATRKRVHAAAERLGYRPNPHARSIRTGRHDRVALLESTEAIRSVAPREMIWAIEDALAKRDMHLTMARLPDDKLVSEEFMFKLLARWSADGLIIHYTQAIPAGLQRMIARYSLPAVWINSKQAHDCVHPDDFGGARQITRRLIDLGHTRIAYADYYGMPRTGKATAHYSAPDRRDGYIKEMRAAKLKPTVLCEGTSPGDGALVAFSKTWLSKKTRPTAVVTYGPHAAVPIIHAAALCGITVPDDLSVATFNDDVLRALDHAVTAARIPSDACGRAAVEMLCSKLDAPRKQHKTIAFPMTVLDGTTCVRPRA